MANTNQGLRQESVRAVTGTTLSYNGDWIALFRLSSIDTGSFNGDMLSWINLQLGVDYTNLSGAMAAFAASQGFDNWGSIGEFTPSSYALPFTNLRTADDYHIDGLAFIRPYDLATDFGAEGTAIVASGGFRYIWLTSSDHYDSNNGWDMGSGVWAGYSNDPGVPPDVFSQIIPRQVTVGDGTVGDHVNIETPWLVYNPDNPSAVFYLYCHGDTGSDGTLGQETCLWRSANLTTWTVHGRSHHTTGNAGHTGYQVIIRRGTGDWISYGLSGVVNNVGNIGLWTSADGLNFTVSISNLTRTYNSRSFGLFSGNPPFSMGGSQYSICGEDARTADGGQYISLVKTDASGNLNDGPGIVRLTSMFPGVYPTSSYLQYVSGYNESGIHHYWGVRGYFASATKEEYLDYGVYVYDATAAAIAAPVGVRARCASGTVTVEWFDALPHDIYRVWRGASATGPWTFFADVTGTSTTDATVVSGTTYYYKVASFQGAVEGGNRVVRIYASAASQLVNQHITRVLTAGASAATIDATWLGAVETWLRSNNLYSNLLNWVNPAFGVTLSGSVAQKIFDLGTTLHPRGGDVTPTASASVYSATGMNGIMPAITNAAGNSFAYFGSGLLNSVRRKTQITVVAAYERFTSAAISTFLSFRYGGGITLQQLNGVTGNVNFEMENNGGGVVTAAVTGGVINTPHVAAGTYDGTTMIAYSDGVAGTGSVGATTWSTNGLLGTQGNIWVLTLGSESARYAVGTGYIFSDNHGLFDWSDLIVFDRALTAGEVASLTTLINDRNT